MTQPVMDDIGLGQLPHSDELGRRDALECRDALGVAVDIALLTADLDCRLTGWDKDAENVLGWREAEVPGRPARMIFTPGSRDKGTFEAEMAQALRDGRAELLTGEMQQWVKNTPALVQTIVSQSLRGAVPPTDAHVRMEAHLRALGRAHDIPLRDDTVGANLSTVVDAALGPYDDGALLRDRPDVWVLFTDVDMADTMGGLASARRVVAEHPEPAVLIVSSKAWPRAGELPEGARFLPKLHAIGVVTDHIRTVPAAP